MRRETLQARKQFAAELAQSDRMRVEGAGQGRVDAFTVGRTGRRDHGGRATQGARVPLPERAVDAEILERYRMRRWWLDRYTRHKALAECLS